jgi:ammonia channel protein AmtB
LDAVAVHFGGGFWGLIAASLFSPDGVLYNGNKKSALVNIYNL